MKIILHIEKVAYLRLNWIIMITKKDVEIFAFWYSDVDTSLRAFEKFL